MFEGGGGGGGGGRERPEHFIQILYHYIWWGGDILAKNLTVSLNFWLSTKSQILVVKYQKGRGHRTVLLHKSPKFYNKVIYLLA